MKDKTAVLDTFELISLEDAEKNGISKYLFYKYLKEKEYLKVAPENMLHPMPGWTDFISFTGDARKLFSPMMRHSTIMD